MVFSAFSVNFSRFSVGVRCKRWVFHFMLGILKCSCCLYTCSTEYVPCCIPPPTETRTATYARSAASLLGSNYHRTNCFHISEIGLIVFCKTTDGVAIQAILRLVGTPPRLTFSHRRPLYLTPNQLTSQLLNLHTKFSPPLVPPCYRQLLHARCRERNIFELVLRR
jgi:hypothetical protein